MDDETLAGLDLVLVSVHSHMKMERSEMTKRVIRALRHPMVDILGHPTGRILSRRPRSQSTWTRSSRWRPR